MAEIFSDADFAVDEPSSQILDESDFMPPLSPQAQAAEDSFVGRLSGGVLRGAGYLGDFAQTLADYSPFNWGALYQKKAIEKALSEKAGQRVGLPGLGDYVRTGITEATKAVGGPEDALRVGEDSWAGTIGEMIPSLLGGPASAIKEVGKKGVVPVLKAVGKAGAEALGLGTTTYGGGEAAEALGVPREYGELAGGIFGAIAPTVVKKVASSTAKTAEQRLTGFDPSKPGRLAGAIDSEGNLIKGAITNDDIIAEQVGKRDIAYRQLEETGVLDDIIGATDNAESVSIKLAQANGSAGERIATITDELAKIEKGNKELVGSTTVNLKNARAFLNRLSKKPGNKNLVARLTAELDDLESRFSAGGSGTIKELDNTRQVWGESTKTTYNPAKSAEDKLIDTYNNLVYGGLRDALDNRAKNLGAYVGQPQIADDLIQANKVYSATKNFTNTAFLASQKGIARQVAGDIIGPRFARAALYGGLAGAGGPIGQAAVLADIARVAATDIFPAQTRALAKGGAKVADLFDVFSKPKAAPIAASRALELDAPATRMGQLKQLDDLRYRSQIHADLAAADKQIDYTGPIKGNPYGGGVITDAAGNPMNVPLLDDMKLRHDVMRADAAHAQKLLDYVATTPEATGTTYPRYNPPLERSGGIVSRGDIPIFSKAAPERHLGQAEGQFSPWSSKVTPSGTSYDPFERGIINPKAKITKPSSKDLTVEEQNIFRRAEPKVTLPPTKQAPQKAQLSLEKQPEAQSSIERLKKEIDPAEFDNDLVSDSSFRPTNIQRGSTIKSKKWEDSTFKGYQYDVPEVDIGAKAVSPRAKLIEWLGLKRESGRVFSSNQLSALQKADSGEGLAFKSNGKKYTADSKATEEFLDAFGRKELTKEQFESLSVALKSETKLNGTNVSPHRTPDVPKDWEEFIKDAPLPESGKVSKAALAALLAVGGVGTQYLPKEKGMEEVRPKEMITAEDLRDAVVYQESRGDATAVSPKGAQGKMQLMPDTGRDLFKRYQKELEQAGVKSDRYTPFDAKQNQFLGTKYMGEMLRIFKDPKLALAGYNAGPGNVRRWMKTYGTTSWDVISAHLKERGAFTETVKYVPSVLAKYEELKKIRG